MGSLAFWLWSGVFGECGAGTGAGVMLLLRAMRGAFLQNIYIYHRTLFPQHNAGDTMNHCVKKLGIYIYCPGSRPRMI